MSFPIQRYLGAVDIIQEWRESDDVGVVDIEMPLRMAYIVLSESFDQNISSPRRNDKNTAYKLNTQYRVLLASSSMLYEVLAVALTF